MPPPATAPVGPDSAPPVVAEAPPACTAATQKKRDIALMRHHKATRAKDTSSNAEIAALYRAYLADGAGCAEAPQARYYLAELLWSTAEATKDPALASQRWEEAAAAFSDAINRGGLSPKVQKEAAYAAILGWKNALKSAPRASARSNIRDDKPRPLSPRMRSMLAAFDDYERVNPNQRDAELAMIQFLRARTYWQHNQFDTAIPQLEAVVVAYPSLDVGEYAANLLLDSLNRTAEWQRFSHWVTKMLATPVLLKGRQDLHDRLRKLDQQVKRKAAEARGNPGIPAGHGP